MKKKIADKWVEALRSGKYKQTRSYLSIIKNKRKSYCCLGVLCELAKKENPEIEIVKEKIGDIENTNNYIINYDGSYLLPPDSVLEWSGLKTEDGHIRNKDSTEPSLVNMNDEGKSFKEIADYIEKNWRKL